MEEQDITLSLPKDILCKVKLIAARRQVPLSALLTEVLTEVITKEEAYTSAKQRHLAWLERGANLGIGGSIQWQREDLHER
jgi:hypothetical protein